MLIIVLLHMNPVDVVCLKKMSIVYCFVRTSNFNTIHSVEVKAQLCPGLMNNGAYMEQLSRDGR